MEQLFTVQLMNGTYDFQQVCKPRNILPNINYVTVNNIFQVQLIIFSYEYDESFVAIAANF